MMIKWIFCFKHTLFVVHQRVIFFSIFVSVFKNTIVVYIWFVYLWFVPSKSKSSCKMQKSFL